MSTEDKQAQIFNSVLSTSRAVSIHLTNDTNDEENLN